MILKTKLFLINMILNELCIRNVLLFFDPIGTDRYCEKTMKHERLVGYLRIGAAW